MTSGTTRPKRRPRTSFEVLLNRHREVAPAALDYRVRRALADPTTPDGERRRLLEGINRDHIVLEQMDFQRGGIESTDGPPETEEDVRVLEAEADRLQELRTASFAERARESREARERMRREAADGTLSEDDASRTPQTEPGTASDETP